MSTSTANLVSESVQDLPTASSVPELNGDGKQKTKGNNVKKSFREKLIYAKNIITVEPVLAAYIIAAFVAQPALINLEYEKACLVNLNYTDEICNSILWDPETKYFKEIEQIQILISNMHSWQYPLQSVMPLILILFIGSYSDRHKLRKPFLLLPIIGEFLSVIGLIFCVIFMKSWPLEAQGIAQTVIPSFFGGQTMIVMASFSYIADVSTMEMRTLRLGIVQIVLNAVVPITHSFAGDLFYKIGYYGILGISTCAFIFAICYGYFCINEPRQPIQIENKKALLADLFDPKQAIDTCNVMLKKNKGNNRLYIGLIMLILFIYNAVQIGEGTVFYFYVQGQFHWNVADNSYFNAVNTVVHLIGTILGVPLFTNILKWSDYTILLITLLNKIVANLIFGFSNTTTMLYVAVIVSIAIGISPVAIRSMATKVVSENDLGKTLSLFGICEALGSAVASPFYNTAIYTKTLTVFPAAFFFVGIILYILCMVIVLFMYIKQKGKLNKVNQQQQQQSNGAVSEEKPTIPMEEFQVTHM